MNGLWRRRNRRREAGQVLILLALFLGILMVAAALVIDTGTHHQVRARTKYVCDAAALAGIAELVASRGNAGADPVAQSKARALAICARNGYVVGQNGVTQIIAYPYNSEAGGPVMHLAQPLPASRDRSDSNRFYVQISRELPQYFASTIGISRTGVTQYAVAAVLGAVPIDIWFDAEVGFPDTVNLAQFGPDAAYTYGDAYSTRFLNNGDPNPRYNPEGYTYDVYIPGDLEASSGSSVVRFEIFDPDTWNQGNVKNPFRQQDQNNDPTEPEVGAIDEIRAPLPLGDGVSQSQFDTAAEFRPMSTQTEFKIIDATGATVAVASYGPLGTTPFWTHRQAPGSTPPTDPSDADPFAQSATDLKWITPVGFQFDTANYRPPFQVKVRTTHGASENGYSMRVSTLRPNGQAYDPVTYGTTGQAALAMYGVGKVPINFSVPNVTNIPIGNIPADAQNIQVTNFDTDIGSQYVNYTMTSFDQTSGQGRYPVLFEAPSNASGSNVVTTTDGRKWYTTQSGSLSTNGQFAGNAYDIPATVIVPRTDGNGNLVLDAQGRVEIVDTRAFQGADLRISYSAGAHDTSVWEVNYSSPGGGQRIVLMR